MYVGGDFALAGGSSANGVAAWDITTSSWSALGGSVNAPAYAFALDSSNQKLYVGGNFTTAAGTTVNRVAVYNITNSTWSALGTGLGGTGGVNGYAFALDSSNQKLYIGGDFTTANGSGSIQYVAVYNISNSTWSSLSTGVVGPAYTLALDSSNQKLYVGGLFTTAGSVASRNYIAVWDIKSSTWAGLSTGLGGGGMYVQSLALDSSNNKLYVGGLFTTAG